MAEPPHLSASTLKAEPEAQSILQAALVEPTSLLVGSQLIS